MAKNKSPPQKQTKPLAISPDNERPDHISTRIERIDNGYITHRTIGNGSGYHTSAFHSPDYPAADIPVGHPTCTNGSIVQGGNDGLARAVKHLNRV
jgi:hypothetical protein